MIPFNSFQYQHDSIRNEVIQAMTDTYDSNWYILGDRLLKFEAAFSAYLQSNYTIGTGNGLDALKIALKTLTINPGDEIIVPANTYIATILAITDLNAVPIAVEPNEHTFNIDPAAIESKITKKTKAIIPVHLFGLPCEMDAIMALAEKYNLFVIEDNAQAVGSTYKNKKTGTFGHVNATSFYPTKNLGALGDGGAINTSNEVYAKKALLLRNYGSDKKYYNELIGYNSRLDEIQASILSVKLNYLDKWNQERITLANYYTQELNAIKDVCTPSFNAIDCIHTYHLYVIKVKQRSRLIDYLTQHNIQTAIHYPVPFYRQNAYLHLGISPKDFPITEKLAEESLSLPLYPGLTKDQQDCIINTIKEFYQ